MIQTQVFIIISCFSSSTSFFPLGVPRRFNEDSTKIHFSADKCMSLRGWGGGVCVCGQTWLALDNPS
jgi:hypothetical protein